MLLMNYQDEYHNMHVFLLLRLMAWTVRARWFSSFLAVTQRRDTFCFRSMWCLDQTGLDWFAYRLFSREACLQRSTLQDLMTRTTIGRVKFYVEKLLSECTKRLQIGFSVTEKSRENCKSQVLDLCHFCHLFGRILAKCVWKYKLWFHGGKECVPPLKLWLLLDVFQSCG